MDDAWGARRLSAGPIAAALEGGDLRALAVAGTPLLARVALVPRGVGWTTAPAIEQRVVVDDGGDGFAVAVTTRHQDAQTDIRFDATIAARADGTLRWHARGHALRDQNLLRAGWSVLLDRRLAGAAYEAITPAGPVRARLPIDVLAQVLDEDGGDDHSSMPALTAMTIALAGAARAQLTLEGSVFELEDQRNWHDASYKLYCPPVADPPPPVAPHGIVSSPDDWA
jgi:hypothetical protein